MGHRSIWLRDTEKILRLRYLRLLCARWSESQHLTNNRYHSIDKIMIGALASVQGQINHK